MRDEDLKRLVGGDGADGPGDGGAHRARLERELLAAWDARPRGAPPPVRTHWVRFATAAVFLVALVSATAVPAQYRVELGRRVTVVLPRGAALPPPSLGERIAGLFVDPQAREREVGLKLLRQPGQGPQVVVDLWCDRVVKDEAAALAAVRALPGLAGAEVTLETLEGEVRDNVMGLLGHRLLRRGGSPEEREAARAQLIELLRQREGAEVDVQVDRVGGQERMRVKVRKVEGDGGTAADAPPPERR